MRLEIRKICVSTAMTGSPNAVFKTTLAVFRPTPGNFSRAMRSWGTTLLCCSINILQVAIKCRALLLYKPIRCIYSANFSSPSAKMAAGVLASRNKLRVARLTLLSVAWAESNTATSSSKVLLYSSSVTGWGFATAKRENISRRCAAFKLEMAEPADFRRGWTWILFGFFLQIVKEFMMRFIQVMQVIFRHLAENGTCNKATQID